MTRTSAHAISSQTTAHLRKLKLWAVAGSLVSALLHRATLLLSHIIYIVASSRNCACTNYGSAPIGRGNVFSHVRAYGILAITLAILLTSCGPAPLGRLNPGAQFAYEIVTDSAMAAATIGVRLPVAHPPIIGERGLAALENSWIIMGYCAPDRILELHAGGARWVAAHECAHLADRLGSYRAAIEALTPPNPNEHMAARLAVMREIDAAGPDYWQTIYNRWGTDAVVHSKILARLVR